MPPHMASRPPQIVLFGGSEHARVVIDIARRAGREVVAVVDDDRGKGGFAGVALLHDAEEAARRHPGAGWCVSIGDNFTRAAVVERLQATIPALRFAAPLVHPAATVAEDAAIGDGTVVMAGVVINPGTAVGRHCIVNTGASLDHDNVLDDFCSVAPGVVTGGQVCIGRGSAVCIGACVQHGIRIGEHTVIGAGAVVLDDVPPNCVAYGVPCRVVRGRAPGDRYL
jgi:sugar O-acyltransferase (sialic acid O-acetyltransferase NeuD family)